MVRRPRRRLLRIVAVTVAGAIALGMLGLGFAWSGLYSVAASRGHWEVMEWLLTFAMRNSVETHALQVEVPPLDDDDLVRLGASHFDGACASCHGAPGIPPSAVAMRMLPPPPDLAVAAHQWKDRELFWIVRNGIKYTGMPAWVALEREDEVWSVVAFLKRLPTLDAASYRAAALGPAASWRPPAAPLAEATTDALRVCARCHGSEKNGPSSAAVPVLHGQSAPYLAASLEAYGKGWRESGIMRPVAAALGPETAAELVAYYAGLGTPQNRGAMSNDRGRALAEQGHAATGIPACLSCHGATALPIYPRLAGQNARYMASQLRLWRDGIVAATERAAIMAPIAQRLTDAQIDDVAAHFAGRAAAP